MSNTPNDGNGVPPEPPTQPEHTAPPAAPDDAPAEFSPPQYAPPQFSPPQYSAPGAAVPDAPGSSLPDAPGGDASGADAPGADQGVQQADAAAAGEVPPPQDTPAAPTYAAPGSSFPSAPPAPYAAPAADQGYPGAPLPPYAAAQPSQGYPGGPTSPYGGGAYGGVPMTPPQPGKALAITSMVLGILGIVGFAVAFIPFAGFIALLVPLAAIVTGVIVLVRKKAGKGFAIAGVVTGAVGLIISALVASIMTSFLVNSEDFARGGAPDSGPVTAPDAPEDAAPASALEVGETTFGAFDESGEYTWFAIELTNPDDVFYEYVYGDVEALAADGTIIDTASFGGALIPGTTVFAGSFASAPTADVAEIQVIGLEDIVSEPVPFEGGEFTVTDLKATADEYATELTGTVSSTFPEDQDALNLTIIVRDESGEIVMADSTSTDRVPADGSARFEKTFYPALPDGLTYEVYPHIY